jgi:N-acetylmuramoyl-L-alanine amidase
MSFLLLTGAEIASSAERTDVRAQAVQGGQPHPVASDSRVGGDDAQTRFVMDFSQKVDLRAFTLADPYRVVIDLPQVIFNLPPKTGETGRGLVKAFRFGLVMQGGSRIVMDVNKPVRIDKAFVIEPAAGQPVRRPAGWSARARAKATRVRSLCSIRATAASTTAPSPAMARWKRISCWSFPPRCATSSNGPASIAW